MAATAMREVPISAQERKQLIQRLKQVDAFRKWKEANLESLVERIRARTFSKDDELVETGEAGDYLYMVASGAVREHNVHEHVPVWTTHTWTKDEWFVRQASYEGGFRASEVTGLEPGKLLSLSPTDLHWALTIQPDLWDLLRRSPMARRLRAMPILAPLGPEEIQRLATIARPREFAVTATICKPQMASGEASVYLIDWGQVRLEGPGGIQSILTAGNFFHDGPRLGGISASRAIAHTAVRIIMLPYRDIEYLARDSEAIRIRLRRPRIQDFLRLIDEFKNLNQDQINALASVTSWEFYPSGQTVTEQGLRGDSLRFLQRGAAIAHLIDEQGRERSPNHPDFTPGRYYGVGSLFHRDQNFNTVRAVLPAVISSSSVQITNPMAASDPAHPGEPGATWLRICYDDLNYLLKSSPKLWAGTKLSQEVVPPEKIKLKYPWQDVDETVVYDGHRHWMILVGRLLWPALFAGVVLGIDAILRNVFNSPTPPLTVALLLVIAVLPAALWVVIDYLNDYFVVTNRRVAARERIVLLYESLNEAALAQIQDTTITRDFWGNLFDFGTIEVKTASKSAPVIFDRVADPSGVQRTITGEQQRVKVEQRAKEREGLHALVFASLRQGIVANAPARALPPSTEAPKRLSWWRRLWQRFKDMRARVFKKMVGILPRPLRRLSERIKRRVSRPTSALDEFKGGLLASWWVTPEKTVWRKHWLILLRRTWLSALVCLAVWILFSRALRTSGLELPWWLALLILGIVSFWFWWQYTNWANDLYIVTTEKMVDIEKLPLGFREKRREGGLDRVQNVVLKLPSFWANLFNIGDVEIQTAATDEGYTFHQVANPREVQREIWRRINDYQTLRRQRESASNQAQQAMILSVYSELMKETGKEKD